MSARFEYAVVGGGLQGGLFALSLLRERPDARLVLIERGPRIGGNHTWSFHQGDVPESARDLVEPLVVARWPGYDVAFPGFERSIDRPYFTTTSERLHAVVSATLERSAPSALLLGTTVRGLGAREVALSDGRTLQADVVLDARGPLPPEHGEACAYQKFVGLELELSAPYARRRPLLMDARVPQRDGFRFVYTLPLSPSRVLVEDTYYSTSAVLDRPALRAEVLSYAERASLRVREVVREEHGVLPLPTRGGARVTNAGALTVGYRGGHFHPTTGYSFPVALRVAGVLASAPPAEARAALERFERDFARQRRFACLLNRLLFSAFAADERRNVLERFHRLPEDTIERFYALELSTRDRARILCGRPPKGFSLRLALSPGAAS